MNRRFSTLLASPIIGALLITAVIPACQQSNGLPTTQSAQLTLQEATNLSQIMDFAVQTTTQLLNANLITVNQAQTLDSAARGVYVSIQAAQTAIQNGDPAAATLFSTALAGVQSYQSQVSAAKGK